MSFESNEDRIERLTERVAQITKIQTRILDIIQTQRKMESDLLNVVILLKQEQLALTRFVISGPLAPDGDLKRKFLQDISDQEAPLKEVKISLAKLDNSVQDLLPPLPGS